MGNTMKIGINPSFVRYWGNQLAFKDLRKSGELYHTSDSTGKYNTGGNFIPGDAKTDASGNPSSYTASGGGDMPAGTFARTLLVRSLGNLPLPYPSGIYHVLYDGEGTIQLSRDPEWPYGVYAANRGETTPGDVSFTINNPTESGILLDISGVPGANYIKNLRIVHHDDLGTYETQPFGQRFLDSIEELSDSEGGYFRSMNWGVANGDGGRWIAPTDFELGWRRVNTKWEDRVIPAMPQGKLGSSLEYAVQICNTINRSLWYNLGHVATDDFITNAATYIKDNLNSSLSVVVEWSNEFWNPAFYQRYYAYLGAAEASVSAQYYGGLTTGPGGGSTGNDQRAANRYGADKSKAAGVIFSSVFGAAAPTRILTVVGGQSSNPWQQERMLEWSGVNSEGAPVSSLDAIAIAPYFANRLGTNPEASSILGQGANDPSSVSEILASCALMIDGETREQVAGNVTVANYYDIDVFTYEGGQHLVGVGTPLDEDMFPIFSACNVDPQMETLYTQYLNMLQDEGIKIACIYRSISKFGKSSMFGLQRFYGDTQRPKYDAVVAFIGATAVSTFFENNLGYRLNINS